jgi:hypothetical protein
MMSPSSSFFSLFVMVRELMPPSEASSSVKRWGPRKSSRTIMRVQGSPIVSATFAIGQAEQSFFRCFSVLNIAILDFGLFLSQ